jgi:hypothetical protein
MMGEQKSEPQLFNYAVNLEKRVRANHPLRRVKAAIDLSFVREEVAHCYGSFVEISQRSSRRLYRSCERLIIFCNAKLK